MFLLHGFFLQVIRFRVACEALFMCWLSYISPEIPMTRIVSVGQCRYLCLCDRGVFPVELGDVLLQCDGFTFL